MHAAWCMHHVDLPDHSREGRGGISCNLAMRSGKILVTLRWVKHHKHIMYWRLLKMPTKNSKDLLLSSCAEGSSSLTNDASDIAKFVHTGARCVVHTDHESRSKEPIDPVDVTAAIQSAAESVENAIAVLDDALKRIDEGLNRSQPAISGKIRIYFAKTRALKRTPFLQEWRKSSQIKKWYSTRLPWKNCASRAKFYGGFGMNHKQTQSLLAEASRLVVLRQEMLAKRRSILLSLRFGAERLTRESELAIERAEQWHAECEEHLALRHG